MRWTSGAGGGGASGGGNASLQKQLDAFKDMKIWALCLPCAYHTFNRDSEEKWVL